MKEKGASGRGYDHFNMAASWNKSLVRSDEYSSDDLTVLRTFEWDRINFTCPAKRERTAERLEMTEAELNSMRRETKTNMYSAIG